MTKHLSSYTVSDESGKIILCRFTGRWK